MTHPAISVVTPTKNRLALLIETLDSVAGQTLAEWEHIVVDDGSDDGTREEVERRAREDPRIRYLPRTREPAGAAACRNLGLAESRADLIVFLDSDDLLEPECLERRVRLMRRNADVDFITFRTRVFETRPGDLQAEFQPDLHGDDLLRFLYFEVPWQTTAPTWRKESIQKLGGFDESLPSWQDVELHVRALAAGLRYLRFSEVDYHFRWDNSVGRISAAQRRSPRHLTSAVEVIRKIEGHVRQGPGMDWVRQRAICSLYFYVAERWLEAGDLKEALHCWAEVRRRRLGPPQLFWPGALLLALQAAPAGKGVAGRILHRWKGSARLRSIPKLVA